MSIGRLLKIIIGVVLVGAVVAFFVWSSQVMPATQSFENKITTDPRYKVTETNHSVVLASSEYHSSVGIVFIPGAKVDPHAYLYKLSGIVEATGVTVVITKPYFNLALLDLRPIATFTGDANDVTTWYVGGHSLGGVRACQYAADQSTHVSGLILFGAYCQSDVNVPAISIRGVNDRLTTAEDVTNNAKHLKGATSYQEIDDASHASFGDYGKQSGDGDASIDSEYMRLQLTDMLSDWLAQR